MLQTVDELLSPLAKGWLGKIDIAYKRKRERFQDIADQCMQFFSGTVGFMYDAAYQQKFMGGSFSPTFKITLNKAFEIVALFGPLIYHQNPQREVDPPDPIDYGPEIFGDPNDPMVQQQYQQAIARDKMRRSVLKSGCQAVKRYLNYTPEEQPNGGLQQASEDAITEALIKGRGVLWSNSYIAPGSNRRLTGSFYDSVDRLLIDPDSESNNFGEAFWIARECNEPHWKLERERGLPYGSLRGKGNLESAESQGASRGNRRSKRDRELGTTFDNVRYWKIWSIGGIGTRMTGTAKDLQTAFDEVVGDYAYLEVARGVDWPLNMPADRFLNATDEDVRQAFSWPVPYWKDQRWPCVMLDFYRQPNCAWPISPLRPGLGELVALNIIISELTHHVYQNSRTVIAVLKSAMKDLEGALTSGKDLCVVGIPEILKDIDHLIKFIQGPPVQYDVWRIIEHLFSLFDKRVGLSELMYGLNPGAASRTSPDAETKQQMLSIRPDYMVKKVEQWQREVTRNEKLCAYYEKIGAETVQPLMGDTGASIFEQTFTNADEETVLREMTCTIRTGSARKPNKQRDAANLKEIYQPNSIQLGQYQAQTGDSGPLNELNRRLYETMEIEDMDGLMMGPVQPPPPPLDPNAPPPPDPAQEAKAENMRTDMQMQQARQTQQMQIAAAQHQQDIQQQGESHAADMVVKMAKLRIDRMKTENKGKAA